MMALVAVVAVMLGAFSALRREFAPTPSEWARDHASAYRKRVQAFRLRDARSEDSALRLARYYEKLAEGFDREPSQWEEATRHGPFTAKLAQGQRVISWQAARARPSPCGNTALDPNEGSPIPPGTELVVVRDPAGDEDDCTDLRGIDVRFVAGPRQGETVSVGRIYLRFTRP